MIQIKLPLAIALEAEARWSGFFQGVFITIVVAVKPLSDGL